MTREEIHKLPWKAQEYINELERKLALFSVVEQSEQLCDHKIYHKNGMVERYNNYCEKCNTKLR